MLGFPYDEHTANTNSYLPTAVSSLEVVMQRPNQVFEATKLEYFTAATSHDITSVHCFGVQRVGSNPFQPLSLLHLSSLQALTIHNSCSFSNGKMNYHCHCLSLEQPDVSRQPAPPNRTWFSSDLLVLSVQ
jgi:hypothetical protein